MPGKKVKRIKINKTPKSQDTLDTWVQSEQCDISEMENSPSQTSTPVATKEETSKRKHVNVSPSSTDQSSILEESLITKLDLNVLDVKLNHFFQDITSRLDAIQSDISILSSKILHIEDQVTKNKTNIANNASEITALKESVEYAHSDIKEIRDALPSMIERNKSKIDQNSQNINQIKQKLEETTKKVTERAKPLTHQKDNNTLNVNASQSRILKEEIDRNTAYSQRHNLIFEGIEEKQGENCIQIVDYILGKYLSLHNAFIVIDKAHRLGPKQQNKTRPIIVRFRDHSSKEKAYVRRKLLKGSGIWMKLHLPPRMERESNLMDRVATLASREDRHTNKVANNKLVYKGKSYTVRNITESDIPVHTLHQKETTDAVFFQGQLSPFSNFHFCTLHIDGFQYVNLEQFYQAERAKCHGAHDIHAQILMETDPVEIKHLARKIAKNPAMNKEDEEKSNLSIMEKGLKVKFEIPRLKQALIKTKNKALVEASKYDTFFGSGIALYDPKCTTMRQYPGQNQLGKLLQKVRQHLLK